MTASSGAAPVPTAGSGSSGAQDALDAFLDAARRDPAGVLLALDFDGTLAPLVPDPADSALLPGVADVLADLGAAGVRIALVTGRAPRTALALSGLGGRAGLEHLQVVGLYGLQVLDVATGTVSTTVDDETRRSVQAVREALPGVLREALPAVLDGAAPGVHVEDKDIALVVHTRRAPDPDRALADVSPAVRALAERHGLRFEPGRLAAEIRPAGTDKGASLLRLVGDAPPATPIRAVLVAGDDSGDLPALRAVPGLRAHGVAAVGIAVAQPGTDPAVLDAADTEVAGPPGLLGLLRRLAGLVSPPSPG